MERATAGHRRRRPAGSTTGVVARSRKDHPSTAHAPPLTMHRRHRSLSTTERTPSATPRMGRYANRIRRVKRFSPPVSRVHFFEQGAHRAGVSPMHCSIVRKRVRSADRPRDELEKNTAKRDAPVDSSGGGGKGGRTLGAPNARICAHAHRQMHTGACADMRNSAADEHERQRNRPRAISPHRAAADPCACAARRPARRWRRSPRRPPAPCRAPGCSRG